MNFNIDAKKHKYVVALAAAVLCIVTIFLILHFHHEKHEKEEAKFPITNPWYETVNLKKEYVSQIKAIQHIELRSLEKGYLQNIYVDEGQFVHKGQKMFQIMPLILEAEFKKSEAEYKLAKIEYDNTLILKKHDIVSANELALTKARLDKAQAEMQLAETHLDFTTVKAPFDGIMDRFHVRLGSLVNEGELLTTLSDNSQMWVYFNVSEADYLNYMERKKNNQETVVELVLANGSLFPHKGKIDTIEAEFNNEVGNVAFRATFPNPDGLLRHGETGTILLTEEHKDALIIPQKSTFEILDKKFVYVVDDENKVHSQEITITGEVPHLFIISAGVSKKDKILLEGLGKVHEGEEIETENQSLKEVQKSLILKAS